MSTWRELLPPNATIYDARHDIPGREQWLTGPWDEEPDKISWTDPVTGRPCLIHRGPLGALCGYVAVDPGHPLHGVGFMDVEDDLAVHGGLTYAASCQDGEDESVGICHVPAPGAPHDVWWFGFDCGHGWDVQPMLFGMGLSGTPLGLRMDDTVYRDVAYVIAECQSLATQLVIAA